ncbi:MAG: N-6 DNA methylase, partial [Fimbriimonadales bacterium]|nr:N-6 DNA methylase [Fimbriimonadales bacterium]
MGFAAHLEHYLNELTEIRQRGASESALRDAFLRMLRTAFPALSETEPLLIEERIPALRVQGGIADALYGSLIFEFKRRLDASTRAEGCEQLTRYLLNQPDPERYFGVLTDGETLEVYAVRGSGLTQVDSLTLSVENADAAALWLDCYLFQNRRLRPTSVDVARRFGEFSPTFKQSLRTLSRLWDNAQAQPAARTKYIEWSNLISIVYGSEVGDENLFLRHTYLALFARVLAFVALYQRAPDEEEVDDLLDGAAFERIELNNFVGDDFFTWADSDALRPLLRSLALRLAVAYDLNTIQEDLLKELYQELVNPQTRHELGEYYTPDWLAELTLREAGFPPSDPKQISLIDPACGSGTFLFTAVRLLKQAGYRSAALVDLCRNLAGIDVQPLAIVIAKTNFVLALGDEVRASGQQIDIPIYMADSLSLPEKAHALIEVPVNVEAIAKMKGESLAANLPKAFIIPVEVGDFPAQFNALIDRLMLLAVQGTLDDATGEILEQNLRELEIPSVQAPWWRANLRLLRWLMKPPTADTVWQFVLKNACRPALLAHRKFRYVVGNPPWLAYRYIRRRDYQERLRELAYHYQLLSRKDSHLFTQTELATIFFAFCANHYLAEGGTLAFVMPRSVLTGAKQHVLFRQQYVATAKQVIDCEQVSPLFNVPACTILWQKTARKPRKQIPCLLLSGTLPSRNESLDSVLRVANSPLTMRRSHYTLPAITNGSPYLARVKQGATLVPRNFWFVRRPPEARILTQDTPYVQTDPRVNAQAKAPWKGIRIEKRIEARFLYATLLSDDLL